MGMFDGSGGDFDFHNYVDYKVYQDITKDDNHSSPHKNKKVKKQDEPKDSTMANICHHGIEK